MSIRHLFFTLCDAATVVSITGKNGSMADDGYLPRRVHSFPHWTDNPFVNLLYLDARSQGVAVVESRTLPDFLRLVSDSSDQEAIHIHWTSPILQSSADIDDARRRRTLFEKAVSDALARGTRLAWSIHNALPHDVRFRDEEIALCSFLSEHASRIHILSSRTEEFVGGLYPLDPAKLARVPHSSYWGVYDQSITRDEAREQLGLGDADTVVGFVGQLRPYKGVDELIGAVKSLQRVDDSVVLLLAGKTWPADLEVFTELLADSPRVIRSHTFVPDDELPTWLRAIDVMALPYRAVLNSGSIALAATFGVPVVTPQEAGFARDFADDAWVTTYPTTGVDATASLADAIRSRISLGTAPVESASAWARAHTPFEMAKEFTDAVLRRL